MKLDNLTQQRLLLADPPVQLGRSIIWAMENLTAAAPISIGSSWHPQRVKNLEELPSAIRAIVVGSRDDRYTVRIDLLTKRVGQLLVLNLWKTGNRSQLRNKLLLVAERFHCSVDGFLFPLHEESYEALLEEFERIITPSPRPSCLSSPGRPSEMLSLRPSMDSRPEGNPYSYTRVDQPAWECLSLSEKILHTLVHRLDIQSTLYKSDAVTPVRAKQDVRSRRTARTRSPAPKVSSSIQGESVFDATVQLQASNDVAARSEVHRLLLDRRYLTPFIAPIGSTKSKLLCDIAALELATTAIDHISTLLSSKWATPRQ